MASTIPPSTALDYAKVFIKRMPLQQVYTQLVNRVAYQMWTYAPWRWTLGSTPSFTLVNATQDYTINYPVDWFYPVRATIVDGNMVETDLTIVPTIETISGLVGTPTQIAYLGSASQVGGPVRVAPVQAVLGGTFVVNGLYKKVMTQFTNQTIYTGFLPIPDEWYQVFQEGILWQAYLYADDRRAGDSTVEPTTGKIQFSGQRGVFEAGLIMMREREPLLPLNPLTADRKDWNK